MESNNFENIGSNIANSESKTTDKNKLLCAFSSFNSKSNLNQTPFTKITSDKIDNIEVIEDKVEVDDRLIILKIDQINNDTGKTSIEANMKPDTMEYSEKAINVEEIIVDENKSVDNHKLVKNVSDSMEESKLIHGGQFSQTLIVRHEKKIKTLSRHIFIFLF